jgi:hypothetical protein
MVGPNSGDMHGNVIDSMVELMTKNKRTDRTVHFGFRGLRYVLDASMACCLLSEVTIVQMDRNIQNMGNDINFEGAG